MNKNYPISLVTAALCWLGGAAHAQQADPKMLPSATGGSNPSIGNLASPSLYDGSANVNIPIYDFSDFGISLGYNTKGVTVDEVSGPVGTHWSLNAGGFIQRTVKDLPDEWNQTIAGTPGKNLKGRLLQAGTPPSPAGEYWDAANDEFQVSAGPLQFSFMLGRNGYVMTYPQQNCRITPIAEGSTLLARFRISDASGNRYYFGTRDNAVNGTFANGNESNTFAYCPKWFLDSVRLANGQTIRYEYLSVNYPSQTASPVLYKNSSRKLFQNGTSSFINNVEVHFADLAPWTYILKRIVYPGNTTATFVFDQGDDWYTSSGDGCMKTVQSIEIKEGNNSLSYRFYKYYLQRDVTQPPYTGTRYMSFGNECDLGMPYKRLMLGSIEKRSGQGAQAETYYSFEYAGSAPPPSRLGNNRDFFGYCNFIVNDPIFNANDNTANPPDVVSPFSATPTPGPQAVNRSNATDVTIPSALVLTKVKNAFGGSVSFQYELHSGLTSPADLIAGMPDETIDHLFLGKNANDGLRLKTMTEEDKYHPGEKRITTYTYSGGQRFLNGGYFSYPSALDMNGNITEYTMTSAWVSPHQLVNGSNHGYSQVTARVTNAAGGLVDKTIYYFSNFQKTGSPSQLNYALPLSGNGSNKHYFQPPYTDKQYLYTYKLGLPVMTEAYNSFELLVSRTTNTYDFVDDNTSTLAGLGKNYNVMRVKKGVTDPSVFSSYTNYATDTFVPFTGRARLVSTTVNKFIDNYTSQNDVVTYGYDDRNNQNLVTTRNSLGETFQLRYIYNYETGAAAGSILDRMTQDGLEVRVGMERWKADDNTLHDASVTGYQYDGNKLLTRQLQMRTSKTPQSYTSYTSGGRYAAILNAYSNPGQAQPSFKMTSEVLTTDNQGNPLETRTGSDRYTAMIWDTISGHKVAEADCRMADMAYTSFEYLPQGTFTGMENITEGRFVSRYSGLKATGGLTGKGCYRLSPGSFIRSPQLVPGHTYILTLWTNGGIPLLSGAGLGNIPLQATDNNGWQMYRARFTAATADYVQLAAGSFFDVDEVRLFPEGARLTATNYTPLFGPSSVTGPDGRITFFEYDALGRPVLTRDQDGNILSRKEYHISQ